MESVIALMPLFNLQPNHIAKHVQGTKESNVQYKFRVFHIGADQGNRQPWHPTPEKILREYHILPVALASYFQIRGISVSTQPTEKLEEGVFVTLEGDFSDGVLEKASEQFLISINTASNSSPDPMCFGAEAV